MVPPGAYQVRLTAEGKSYTAPLELKADPRAKVSNDDLQKQSELGRKIVAQVTEIHEAVGTIREVRTQTRGLGAAFRRRRALRIARFGDQRLRQEEPRSGVAVAPGELEEFGVEPELPGAD